MTSLSPAVEPSSDSVKPTTGTTVLALRYDGGVVIAADTRVSIGSYICNRSSSKIAALSDNVFLARSGSAADTQIVSDHVSHYVQQHALDIGRDPDVASVAHIVSQINYRNKHLQAAVVLAGWDSHTGGQVYSIPIGGTLVKSDWAIDGSGSTFIWGLCDALYKEGMTRQEAEDLATALVGFALATDAGSGGMCRLVTVESSGVYKTLKTPDQFPEIPFELRAGLSAEGTSGGMIID